MRLAASSRAAIAWAITPSGASTVLRAVVPALHLPTHPRSSSSRALSSSSRWRQEEPRGQPEQPLPSDQTLSGHPRLHVPVMEPWGGPEVMNSQGRQYEPNPVTAGTIQLRGNRKARRAAARAAARAAWEAEHSEKGELSSQKVQAASPDRAQAAVATEKSKSRNSTPRQDVTPAPTPAGRTRRKGRRSAARKLRQAETKARAVKARGEKVGDVAEGPKVSAASQRLAERKKLMGDKAREERARMDKAGRAGAVKPEEEEIGEEEISEILQSQDVDGAAKFVHAQAPHHDPTPTLEGDSAVLTGQINARDVQLETISAGRDMVIATLRTDLERVLFSPGVHHLRDPRTGVRNFSKSLDGIPTADEFAFERLPQYIPPSHDEELRGLAREKECRFFGSTSTLTKALSQVWFALSGGRGPDLSKLSTEFASERWNYTAGAELPAFIVLRPMPEDGVWAVDQDKSYDVANALSDYGRILEKQLTATDDDMARFLRTAPDSAVPQAEREEREAYTYRKAGSILMRSQLDCHHPKLPGTGVFDIKTRACFPLRHDRANVAASSVHDIYRDRGTGASFERELYDLARSTMLKYSMQVRIGQMDGIFVAYHNTVRMYGYQYLTLADMDQFLFGSTELAEQAFRLSVALFEQVLMHITEDADINGEPISVVLKAVPKTSHAVDIMWGPVSRAVPDRGLRLSMVNEVNGKNMPGEISFKGQEKKNNWRTHYSLTPIAPLDVGVRHVAATKMLVDMASLHAPEGRTAKEMQADEVSSAPLPGAKVGVTWTEAGRYVLGLREEAKRTGREYQQRIKGWVEE